jgi:hypothetical protein
VDLERVRPVLQGVLDRKDLGGELAKLAHGHESGLELVGHRGAEDEAARFHAHDDVDLLVGERRRHEVDGLLVGHWFLEQRRDVVEQDARLREVGDLADELPQVVGGGDGHRRSLVGAERRSQSRPPHPSGRR